MEKSRTEADIASAVSPSVTSRSFLNWGLAHIELEKQGTKKLKAKCKIEMPTKIGNTREPFVIAEKGYSSILVLVDLDSGQSQ